ncbi:MAG: hypothetical protein KAV45_12020 [Calditrichia bacterium]|nr:hypothetical protein [Calditrichia bacterium]
MLKALYQSVFAPDSFLKNPKGLLIVNKYGWLFIVIRWLSYSIIFSFRDYHGNWKPFAPPPFGIDLETYAFLQTQFSLLFGIFVMGSITFVLSSYLRLIKKDISIFKIFNILGVTFFLPFVIVQPVDIFVRFTVGWISLLIIPIHTIILLWESLAATSIISNICRLKWSEKVISIMVIIILWVVICAILWR